MNRLDGVTRYSWPTKYYFLATLAKCQAMATSGLKDANILDFGCGVGMLRQKYPNLSIIGFDVIPELSEVPDWRSCNFEVLVANHVFYSMSQKDLEELVTTCFEKKVRRIVFSDSKAGWLNYLFAIIFFKPRALSKLRRTPRRTLEILLRNYELTDSGNVWGLTSIYCLDLREEIET